MTAENQRARDFLAAIETAVHETLAGQPSDDRGCAAVLERGIGHVQTLVDRYHRGDSAP